MVWVQLAGGPALPKCIRTKALTEIFRDALLGFVEWRDGPRFSAVTPGMITPAAVFVKPSRIIGALLLLTVVPLPAETIPPKVTAFIDRRCADCHDDVEKKGGLDLLSLNFEPANGKNFDTWVKVYDRVIADEMPPRKKPRPEAEELAYFTQSLESALTRLSHDAALRTHLAAGAAASITRLGLTWRSNAQRVAQLAAALRPAQPAATTTSGSVKLP